MGWKAIAASVEGASHIQYEKLSQDYSQYDIVGNNVIVGAVADGAGSAKHSKIGAQLSVDNALSYLKQWLKDENKRDLEQAISEELAKEIFRGACYQVLEVLKRKADIEKWTLNDLACTLLAFIATPYWIAAMQIGDGFIVIRSLESEYKLLFKPDKGEYANETTFVTSKNVQNEIKINVLSSNPTFICASTDGLERLAINFRDWNASPGFFKPFEDGIKTAENLDKEKEDIKKWLSSKDVNTRTDDDKTLLLCFYDGLVPAKIDCSEALINSENTNYQLLAHETSIREQSSIQPKIPGEFITVSFISHVFAGCLFHIFFKKQNTISLIFFVISIIAIILVSMITFRKLLIWKKYTKKKKIKEDLNNYAKFKTFSQTIKNTYQIREVIAWSLGNTVLGLSLGWLSVQILSIC